MMQLPPSASKTILTSKDWFLALALVIVTLLIGSAFMIKGVTGVFHDDGIYVSTAKALAEGQGYRLINLPQEPRQTKYPPLYPALLALVWKLSPRFPKNLILMQWLTLVCGGGLVGLSYLYVVRFGYFSRSIAAAAAALTLTSAFFMYFCVVTLAEMSLGLLSLVALWCLERQDEGQSLKPVGQFCLGALLTLPFLTRTIGVLFIPVGFYLLWQRGRPLGWAGLGATVLLVPWLVWMLVLPRWAATDTVTMYYTNYLTWCPRSSLWAS